MILFVSQQLNNHDNVIVCTYPGAYGRTINIIDATGKSYGCAAQRHSVCCKVAPPN